MKEIDGRVYGKQDGVRFRSWIMTKQSDSVGCGYR